MERKNSFSLFFSLLFALLHSIYYYLVYSLFHTHTHTHTHTLTLSHILTHTYTISFIHIDHMLWTFSECNRLKYKDARLQEIQELSGMSEDMLLKEQYKVYLFVCFSLSPYL